jgi:DNA polymerase-3 subunit epsilon
MLSIAAALDTETTGLSSVQDEIIEVGLQLFRFDPASGEVLELLESYTALQDPGFRISSEIQGVTGISPEMLIGQKIDWSRVDELLARAEWIVAHNAGFDRGFVDRKSQVSPKKLWVCSSWQVDWRGKGFKNAKLQDLCVALNIAHDAHRAMGDVSAMLRLIGSEDALTGKRYLAEILQAAHQELAWLWVEGNTFDKKDLLKANGFRWNGERKIWAKQVPVDQSQQQVEFVKTLVPNLRVQSRVMELTERFK